MPEICEVEQLRARLARAWEGNTIWNLQATPRNVLKYPQRIEAEDFCLIVETLQVQHVTRHGKYLKVFLEDGILWLIHLKSTGWFAPDNQLAVDSANDTPLRNKFTHSVEPTTVRAQIEFKDGQVWNYHDARTWGKWYLYEKDECALELTYLGPDWLNDSITAMEAVRFHKSKRRTKDVLLDQKVAAGIGNYLACEVLWRAGIHPHLRWDLVSDELRKWLTDMTLFYLHRCLQATDRSHWAVFQRAKAPCWNCSEPIAYVKDRGGNRGSYFCPKCQAVPDAV